MPLGELAPWIIPPNYLEAIRSGSAAGLQLGQMQQNRELAQDRLSAAYTQLQERERNQDYIAQLREQGRQAAIEMQKQHYNDLLSLGQQKLDLQQNQLDQAKDLMGQKLDQSAQRLDQQARIQDQLQSIREQNLDLKRQQSESKVSEEDKMDYRDALETIRDARKTLASNPSQEAASKAQKDILDAQNTVRKIRGLKPLPVPEEEGTPPDSGKGKAILSAFMGVPGLVREAYLLAKGAEKAPDASGRVRVKSPDGKVGTIPSDQLDEAKKAGYTEVQ